MSLNTHKDNDVVEALRSMDPTDRKALLEFMLAKEPPRDPGHLQGRPN